MKANLNENTSWVCSGTADFIECYIFSNDQDRAIQIEAVGLNLSTATTTVYGITGAAQVITFPAGTTEVGSVGGDNTFLISKVKVSNLAAGTYNFRFSAV